MSARIPPLEPPYTPEMAATLTKWMPPNSPLEPLVLFRTLAQHPDLFERMRPLAAGLLGRGTFPPADRELLINRTCARCGCQYEWGVHVEAFGEVVGFSREKLLATYTATATDAIWSERERWLIQLVDELHDASTLSEAVWQGLCQHWTPPQVIEAIVIVGFYHLISFAANGLKLDLEAWAAVFPA